MLIAWVSDERFLAVPDALVTVDGTGVTLRSGADGSVHGELPPGRHRVTVARDGFGSKRTTIEVGDGPPAQLRLLSETLYGFAWPKWVRAGDRASLHVHSPRPYRLALARLGAEAGDERVLGWFDEHGPRTTVQPTPDGDYTQAGVDWHAALELRAPAEQGLYVFRAEDESGARTTFPWIVAPAEPSAPVAVLVSTNTWNAYDSFGGRSNYINAARLPDAPTVVAREDLSRYRGVREHRHPDDAYTPLSFRRPDPANQVTERSPDEPLRGRQPCHLAAAVWRLLAWLEREGFAYDLYADAQLHDGTLDLERYGVLVLDAHPEYWTRTMVDRVDAFVHERGGKLLYLGGNGLDCEVELLDGPALRFRTERVEPGGPYESRLHRTHRATARLLGVCFDERGIMTAAPYEVVDAGHWAFAGTGLAAGDAFGTESQHERCPGGASGHETDKRTAATPPGAVLLARGLNADGGGAELVWYAAERGGEVFAAGSIAWIASLLVDEHVSRITRNALERFLA
ncbi:MAG TPA: N,N-dimethylformamidase beta subunit family domain-containing protein [Gaiellaceae bacterium]|nr:N,N-dimethylformamidase beta subunit family domain-containing protein [Gaiellaceae bacterium]